ncbi:hypothetical protein SAMN05518854_101826 [Variovorax sp. YR266]|nr:hypothetical protein SAMN05518854_101826 [Variovorax sp. YR266]
MKRALPRCVSKDGVRSTRLGLPGSPSNVGASESPQPMFIFCSAPFHVRFTLRACRAGAVRISGQAIRLIRYPTISNQNQDEDIHPYHHRQLSDRGSDPAGCHQGKGRRPEHHGTQSWACSRPDGTRSVVQAHAHDIAIDLLRRPRERIGVFSRWRRDLSRRYRLRLEMLDQVRDPLQGRIPPRRHGQQSGRRAVRWPARQGRYGGQDLDIRGRLCRQAAHRRASLVAAVRPVQHFKCRHTMALSLAVSPE